MLSVKSLQRIECVDVVNRVIATLLTKGKKRPTTDVTRNDFHQRFSAQQASEPIIICRVTSFALQIVVKNRPV